MGYQESLIRVNSLAEIAGIEKAIAESEELQTLEYLVCVCGAKAKGDLYCDNTFMGSRPLSDIKPNEEPIIRAGDLFAVVAGARLYQPFLWIDCIAGISDPGYEELMEDFPLDTPRQEAILHPDEAKKAEIFMRRSLNQSYNRVMRGERPIQLPEEFINPPDPNLKSPLAS
ncbi:hypothetical protein [Collinsella aerofaciens]|uniref:hypothetical protein n=1 Tax=Collinsella aerofaciens TaxID=74426 RepID=UPI003564EB23